jgi:hypothetical protein
MMLDMLRAGIVRARLEVLAPVLGPLRGSHATP